jgi:hypothetical protein
MKNSVFHLNESAQRNLARRSVFAFAVLASFYSKSFLLGTLYYYYIVVSIFWMDRIHQSPLCLPIPPLEHIFFLFFSYLVYILYTKNLGVST